MLESLSVKGFRSLNPLYVEFREGLNVFVGANGSGKSNFISFLNFLHDLTDRSIHHVVERAGGISRVFSRENVGSNVFELEFQLRGRVSNDRWTMFSRNNPANEHFFPEKYYYAAKVVFDLRSAILYIKEETVEILDTNKERLRVQRTTTLEGDTIESDIKLSPIDHPYFAMSAQRASSVEEYLESLSQQVASDTSLLSSFAFGQAMVSVGRSELSALSLVNIDPNKVRDSDSLTDYPFVESNGAGTIPALFALSSDNNNYRRSIYYGDAKKIFNSITSWSKEVMQELVSIEVTLDSRNLKYSASVNLDTASGAQRSYPFSTLSDGTLKWISLVTILFTSGGQFTIEEPENFLHPRMQRTLVSLLRSVLKNERKEQFFITTHSETFLDACTVDELYIVDFHDGVTSVDRPSNAKEIALRLEQSQFGLGHYYKTGAIYAS